MLVRHAEGVCALMTHSDSEYDYPPEEIKNKRQWPEIWIKELVSWISTIHHTSSTNEARFYRDNAIKILNALHDHNAIKDPPQPREIWWCPVCRESSHKEGMHTDSECMGEGKTILMREVIE